MLLYEKFFFNGMNWRYGQVFWNYIYSIQELLSHRLKKEVSVIWNNIHKTHPEMRDIEAKHFDCTRDEIKIFNPDIIILLGLGESNTLLSRLAATIDKTICYKDNTGKERLLYHSINLGLGDERNKKTKKVILTYHPNARGDSGIKMKLLIDELIRELQQ